MAPNLFQLFCIFAATALVTCNSDVAMETPPTLQQQVQALQAAFQRQNEFNENLKTASREQLDFNEKLKTVSREQAKRIEDLAAENKKLKAQLQSHTRDQQKRDYRSASQSVGFHVSLSTTIALGYRQIIIFDTVVTNDGNGYDTRHGHFTAPVSGLYAFAITILCNRSESSVHAAIIRDGEMVGNAHSNGDNYDSGSKLVVIQLLAGQMVWVEHFQGHPGYQLFGNDESTFSGFLISAY